MPAVSTFRNSVAHLRPSSADIFPAPGRLRPLHRVPLRTRISPLAAQPPLTSAPDAPTAARPRPCHASLCKDAGAQERGVWGSTWVSNSHTQPSGFTFR